ncbi:ISAs1 family transposase [Phormidesmis sp. 146-20]
MICVKANQKTLYHHLQQAAQSDAVFSVHLHSEQTRSRQTTRVASIFALPEEVRAVWTGAQQGVEVRRSGHRQGKPYEQCRYYITSWTQKADALQARIRAHWGIENPLHWGKDVVLGEDSSSIAKRNAATVMAVIRNLAITLFRQAGHASITEAIDLYSNRLEQLLPMVGLPSG